MYSTQNISESNYIFNCSNDDTLTYEINRYDDHWIKLGLPKDRLVFIPLNLANDGLADMYSAYET